MRQSDIRRAPNVLIRKYGGEVEIEAARRQDFMQDRGDDYGRLARVRIRQEAHFAIVHERAVRARGSWPSARWPCEISGRPCKTAAPIFRRSHPCETIPRSKSRAHASHDCRDFRPSRILEFGGATDSPLMLDRPRGFEPVITCNLE
jgi:hypothetical protein